MRRAMLHGLIAAATTAALAPSLASACSACGCTLNSDWSSQGLAAGNGWRVDVRFDGFNQDQLRSGTDSVSRSSLELPNEEEIQQYTINRNYTFALDYAHGDWGIAVALPWFDRAHATIAEGETGLSTSHDRGVGDLRLLARFAGFDPQHQTGILFGIKLPTGSIDATFRSGSEAGETVDRGLQLGTGTVDLLAGVYRFGAVTENWGYFGQALLSQPLGARDGFRPGTGVNLNAGVRYTASETWVPQLQLNARIEKRERGANADIDNSGATLLYLSPGITWNVSRRLSAYAFVQVPLYQRVNGLQIEPTRLGSVGFHYRF